MRHFSKSSTVYYSNKYHLSDIATTQKKINALVDMSIQEIMQNLLVEIKVFVVFLFFFSYHGILCFTHGGVDFK